MSVWKLYHRARNIGTQKKPYYVTLWTGHDEEKTRRWLVNTKPDPTTIDGPIYGVNGGPASIGHGATPTSIQEAIAKFKEEIAELQIL